jgi:bacterioferritin (cytochrome b1)
LTPLLDKTTWENGEEALRDALKMEKIVTSSIKKIIDVCSESQSNVRMSLLIRFDHFLLHACIPQ